MDDDELAARIQQGDRAAAEALIDRYYAAILRYCRRCCGDRERAEDLTQETFLRLFRALPGYRGRGKFRAFLYTIADRLCIDESRRIRLYPLEDGSLPAEGRDELRRAEDRLAVDELLAVLSPEQRKAVVLRYGEQLTFREISEVTGCHLRTVQSRVRCALKTMRKVMDDEK